MRKMNKNKNIWLLASLTALSIAYVVIRFPFFELHRMSQWSFILFLFGLITILIAGVFNAKKVLIFTPLGYGIAFVTGRLFYTTSLDSGGGELSNQWLIWTVTFVAVIIIGGLWDRFE